MKRLYLLVALALLLLGGSWFTYPDLTQNGLMRDKAKKERIAILTSNDLPESDEPYTTRWSGYIFFQKADEIYFRVPPQATAKLTIADEIIYDSRRPATSDKAVFYSSPGAQPISLEITVDPKSTTYFQGGLEWQTPVGWQIVPAIYLYPANISAATFTQVFWQINLAYTLASVALSLLVVVAGYYLITHIQKLLSTPKSAKPTLYVVLIVLIGLAIRLFILPSLVNDILPLGTDHRGYQVGAIDVWRGTFGQGTAFYVQPGMSLFMGFIYSLIGVNIRAIQLIQLLLGGTVATILIFDLARRIFNLSTGYLAAILWIIFPLPIFFETQLLTHGLEPHFAIGILWLWYQLLSTSTANTRTSWKYLIGLGLSLGFSATIRPTFLIIAPPIALSLLWIVRSNLLKMIWLPTLLAVVTFIPIAPITWHNYQQAHRFQLLTSNSDITLYLGNNRDSTGLGEYSPSFLATHTLVRLGKTSYVGQTIAEIQTDPVRWLQLLVRKTALYLGDPELPNNIDFYKDGVDRSNLLALLPIRFGIMIALAIAGIIVVPSQQRDWKTWLFVIYLLIQIAVTVAYHVFSRFRAPIYSTLPIFAAYAVAILIQQLRHWKPREALQAFITTTACTLFISAMPPFAEWVMSKPILTTLPPTAKILNAKINDSLTLVGYDSLPAVAPGEPFFITLYWHNQHPLPTDYYATMQIFADKQFFTDISTAQKITQADQPIGTGSFPDFPTSQWPANQLVWDRYFLEMPNLETPQSLTVLVGVYDRATGQRLGDTTFGYLPATKAEILPIPPTAKKVYATVGTTTLVAYTLTDPSTINLYWQAGEPMKDQTIFIHFYDSTGNFLVGQDSRPRSGAYSTQAWQRNESIVDEHPLTLPPNLPKGEYTIKVGMYETGTQNRAIVIDATGKEIEEGALVIGVFDKR